MIQPIEYVDRSRLIAAAVAAKRIIDLQRRQVSVCAYGCAIPYFLTGTDEDLSLTFMNDEPYHKLCARRALTCTFCNLEAPTSPSYHYEMNGKRACVQCVKRSGVPAARLKALKVLKMLSDIEQDGVRVLKHVTAFMDLVARACTRIQLVEVFEQLCNLHHEIGRKDLSLSKVTLLAIVQLDIISSKCLFAELDHPIIDTAELYVDKFFAMKRDIQRTQSIAGQLIVS